MITILQRYEKYIKEFDVYNGRLYLWAMSVEDFLKLKKDLRIMKIKVELEI